MSSSRGAAGVLDFCPVSSGVGKIAVLFNGDLKRSTVSHGTLSLPSIPRGVNMSGLGHQPIPYPASEQSQGQGAYWVSSSWPQAGPCVGVRKELAEDLEGRKRVFQRELVGDKVNGARAITFPL